MTTVRFTPTDVQAIDRALVTLEAERAAAEKWRIVSPDLEEAQETLIELRDRMLAEQALVAGAAVFPSVSEWKAAYVRRLRRQAS